MFGDLTWPDGQDNIGGTGQFHFYCLFNDILTWPTPKTVAALGDGAILEDDFIMKTGKKFYKLYSTLDTGKVEDKNVGEFDGKSFESSFTFLFPGTKAEALDLIRQWNNSSMVFVAVEGDGQRRVIGNEQFSAKLQEGTTTTGLKTADRKGTSITVTSRGVTQAKILDPASSVPLTPAP